MISDSVPLISSVSIVDDSCTSYRIAIYRISIQLGFECQAKFRKLPETQANADPRTTSAGCAIRDKVAAYVKQLVAEADRLTMIEGKYAEGAKKSSEAIKLVPDYGPAYWARAIAYRNYYVTNGEKISYEAGLKQLQYSLQDYQKWAQLDPTNPGAVIGICVALNQISYHTDDQEHRRKALKVLNAILSAESISKYHRAEAHSTRGGVLDGLGNSGAALRDHNEAIRLYPNDAGFLESRGYYWQGRDNQARANADLSKSRRIREGLRRRN